MLSLCLGRALADEREFPSVGRIAASAAVRAFRNPDAHRVRRENCPSLQSGFAAQAGMYEDAAMSKLPPRPDQPISVENGSSSAVEQQAPAWLRGPRWRRWLMIVGLFLVGWTVLFGGWIGIALLRGSTERNAGAVAFNIVLVVFMASVMFLLLQRGIYRWFWHIERRRGHGGVGLDDRMMRFGAVRTDAPPLYAGRGNCVRGMRASCSRVWQRCCSSFCLTTISWRSVAFLRATVRAGRRPEACPCCCLHGCRCCR